MDFLLDLVPAFLGQQMQWGTYPESWESGDCVLDLGGPPRNGREEPQALLEHGLQVLLLLVPQLWTHGWVGGPAGLERCPRQGRNGEGCCGFLDQGYGRSGVLSPMPLLQVVYVQSFAGSGPAYTLHLVHDGSQYPADGEQAFPHVGCFGAHMD